MTQRDYFKELYGDDEDERVIQHGDRIHVPMMFADADVEQRRRMCDSIRAACDARNVRRDLDDAYREYRERVSSAWQGSSPRVIPATTVRDEADADPRDAAYRNYCDRVSRAFRDGRDDRQAAYDEYIERVTTVRDDSLKAAYRDRANYLANAWRTNR